MLLRGYMNGQNKRNIMDKQTPAEWLETTVKSMIINGGDLGDDGPALLTHIETCKKKESEFREYLMDFENWKEWKNNQLTGNI